MMKHVWMALGMLFAASICAAQPASQTYPVRPIRLVASNPPGSGSDVVARVIAPRLSELLGQQIVVDNRAGASGLIAAEIVARAAPDGYTIWIVTMTQLISTTMFDRFHLAKGYAPVALFGATPFIIVVGPSLPVKSTADFIAFAKGKPGFVMYGSAGSGTSGHLCMELLQSMTGTKLVHVPYKGSAQALTEVLGGQMHSTCTAAPTVSLVANQPKARVLGVTAPKPTVLAPGLPTIAETLPGFELMGWYGMLAPPGAPKPVVARLNQELVKLVNLPDMRERLLSVGAEPAPLSPEEFGVFLKKETERWSRVLKEAGIKP
jgi:tripartite-type tricarboxylate transporter receptor subunit TctC